MTDQSRSETFGTYVQILILSVQSPSSDWTYVAK